MTSTTQSGAESAKRARPRHTAGLAQLACVLWLVLGAPASLLAADVGISTLRIGTGGSEGVYFPLGTLLAEAINRSEMSAGEQSKRLLATPQTSNGSVANVEALRRGRLEAALVQADVAYWAHTGTAIYAGEPHDGLRAVANLYPESVHLVVRRAAGFKSVWDLRGHRVSLDEPGSGTLQEARIILAAFGLDESDLDARYVKMGPAITKLRKDELDAFFVVNGYPAEPLVNLAIAGEIDLLPIRGELMLDTLERYPHLVPDAIPAGIYAGIGQTPTLQIGAQLVVDERLDEDTVYRITRVLWSEDTRITLEKGHPVGHMIRRDNALKGVGIPLHAGAQRYYREAKLLPTAGGG